MEGMKSWDNRRNRNRAFNSQPPATADIENNGDPMGWEPTQTVNIAAAQRNPTGQANKSPRLRATWVSQQEIGRRISEGLCIRCGERGHIIRRCSLLPALNPSRQNRGQMQQSRVSAPVVPTDLDDRSGKE
ncbi:hypothetical protein K3495_g14671 [Podosphaera aphanis]|nr:hypothetical protein K3495_g14671 [Podosphaera aphanis]